MEEHRKIRSVDDIETKEKTGLEISTEPCRMFCECCRKEVTTFVKTEFNFFIWGLIIFSFYFYGFKLGLMLLIPTIPLFRNVTHSCPYCLDLLLEKSFYPIQFKEKYCSLQYGKCVIIFRQIYVYCFIILILCLGFYLNITYILSPEATKQSYHSHTHEIDETVKNYYSGSDLSWEDLIKDCGSYVMTENSARANEIFNRRYYKRIITWKGYFLSAFVQARNPMDFNPEHLMNINVRMIPSESIQNPDLFLSLDLKKYQEYGHLIRTLETGTPILFKASLEALGNEWRSHHLHLISMERTQDFIDHDHKVVLFQGINFNITGHMRNDREIRESLQIENTTQTLTSASQEVDTNQVHSEHTTNSTDSNNSTNSNISTNTANTTDSNSSSSLDQSIHVQTSETKSDSEQTHTTQNTTSTSISNSTSQI